MEELRLALVHLIDASLFCDLWGKTGREKWSLVEVSQWEKGRNFSTRAYGGPVPVALGKPYCCSCSAQTCSFLQVSRHERRISQIQQLNQMPLYPTEKIIWDENIVPTEYYSGEGR